MVPRRQSSYFIKENLTYSNGKYFLHRSYNIKVFLSAAKVASTWLCADVIGMFPILVDYLTCPRYTEKPCDPFATIAVFQTLRQLLAKH